MKRFLLVCLIALSLKGVVIGQTSFTAGNLAILRYGENTSTFGTGSTSIPVFVDEYSLGETLTLVKSTEIVGVVGSGNGPNISEGSLALSPDGTVASFIAYKEDVGKSNLASQAPTTVKRVVATIGINYNVNSSTLLDNIFSTPRGAVVNGNNCWIVGTTGGVYHTTLGTSGAATVMSSAPGSGRAINIYDGDLYFSTNAGSSGRMQKISGLSVSVDPASALPGFETTGNPYGFVFFDMNPAVPGVDLVYVADDSNPYYLKKYTFDGIVWASRGKYEITIGTNKVLRDLTGTLVNGKPTIYGATFTSILKFVDESPSSTDVNGVSASLLLNKKTGTKEVFKGITFTPGTNVITLPVELTGITEKRE